MTLTIHPSPLTDELGADGRQASAPSSRVIVQRRCQNCGEAGHYRKTCTGNSPSALLEVARAEVARLTAEVERLTIEAEESAREIDRIRKNAAHQQDETFSARPFRLAKVAEVDLTCMSCGLPCERAVVHRDRERDQGHTPSVYAESMTVVRAVAIADQRASIERRSA